MTIETLERAKEIQRELHECSKSIAVFDKMLANDYFGDELVAVTFVRGSYFNEVRNGHTLRVEQDQVRAFLLFRMDRLKARIKELNKELKAI